MSEPRRTLSFRDKWWLFVSMGTLALALYNWASVKIDENNKIIAELTAQKVVHKLSTADFE